MKKLFLLSLMCTIVNISLKAADEIISIKQIIASDSYVDPAINTTHLYSFQGMSPNPPLVLSESKFQRVGWNAWHTQGNNNVDVNLLIEFNALSTIDKLYIWNFNQDHQSGSRDIKDITIHYSTDGESGNWVTLGDFVVPASPSDGVAIGPQMILPFGEVSARFVKIDIHSSYEGDNWGFGKLFFTRPESQLTGIGELRTEVIEAQKLHFYHYTDGTWEEFYNAMKAAEALINSDSGDPVVNENTLNRLIDAKNDLERKVNLAINAQATAEDFYENIATYNGQKAIDQDLTTRWATNKTESASIIISKTLPITFNQICLFEFSEFEGRMKSATIQISNNLTEWTTWGEKNVRDTYVSIVGEEVSAYYIKIEIDQHNDQGINLAEVMIFNDPTAIETKEPTPPRPIDPNWITQAPSTSPDVYQVRKAGIKYGMFIHYGINTFVNQEWTDGSYPPSTYNPNVTTLDPESWVKAAYEGGMNFIILVTKHHDGFVLWNSSVGTYTINHTGRADDKRDIVKEVADACKKYGIKLGLYYSIWDRNWDRNNTRASRDTDAEGLNQLYNDFALTHITELLDGRYGEICELWIDGAWVKPNRSWEFDRMYDTVKRLQPSCALTINCTIKNPNNGNWVFNPAEANGGEEMYFFPSDFRLMDGYMTKPGAQDDPKIYTYNDKSYYLPFEATIRINSSWFWNPAHNSSTVKSSTSIANDYNQLIAQGNTLVLNLSPNKDGLLTSFDVKGLYEAARLLGIERGDARLNVDPTECEVEVRYETITGEIAYPSMRLYGENQQSYKTTPLELGSSGYKLISTPTNHQGVFEQTKQVIIYQYEDYGAPISSIVTQSSTNENFSLISTNRTIEITSKVNANVEMVNLAGVTLHTDFVSQGTTRIIETGTHPKPLLLFIKGNDGTKKVFKIIR